MRCSFLLIVTVILGCQPKDDLPVVLELDDHWEFRQLGDTLWRSATVPGNVYTDLLDHQLIVDPFVGTNESKVQWVSESKWEYRTHFKLSAELLQKNHLNLSFNGLDTYAEVYLNDSLLLKANNAFRTWSLLTDKIKSLLRSENELRIVFNNPSEIEEQLKTKLSYQLPEGNRIFTRKAQFQYGWDWGPRLNTMGIWRPVNLVFWDEGRLSQVNLRTERLSDSLAVLDVGFSFHSSSDQNLTFEFYANDSLVKIQRDKLPYANKTATLKIKDPKLWWPHNLGDPYLYDIKVVVKDGKRILDSSATKYGIRDVELVNERDSLGTSFYFKINGQPVYAKGANYIPQNSFQNQVSESDYVGLLEDVVAANMNMLRVWGGGIYEDDKFYALCDEKGIMVWQDFMFACAMYPGDQDFLNNVKQEAIDNVNRLKNHPSIVLWCGNNENSEGWHRWGWQDGRSAEEKEEIWDNYLKVFDSILPDVVKNYSDVDYWESSPQYGRGDPKYQFEGDAHDWWVWHDAYPFEHFENEVPRFMSEFGFQSFPSMEVLKMMNDSVALNLNSEAIKNHQKHPRGFQLIKDYMSRDFPVPDTVENYLYMSQLVQAYGITKGIEAHRRAKPYNMGTLFWQLNDCWPAISWSSIDYLGRWKALHYKAKERFENLLISPKLNDKNELEIWVINDDLRPMTGILNLRLINFEGDLKWEESHPIKVAANSSKLKWQQKLGALEFDFSELVLRLTFKGNERLFYFVKHKDLALQTAPIERSIERTKGGFNIELKSPTLQKDVFLATETEGRFKNNFFDLLPNASKTIFFESQSDTFPDLQILSFNSFIRQEER